MFKKIDIDDLRPGMYIADLNCNRTSYTPPLRFGRIPHQDTIKKIKEMGINEVYIDIKRGPDVDPYSDDQPPQAEQSQIQITIDELATLTSETVKAIDVCDEIPNAKVIYDRATELISGILHDAKIDRAIDTQSLNALATNLLNSILRNHNALAALGRMREKNNYLLQHSINVAVLMGIFCKTLEIDLEKTHHIIIGSLLHDIGKVRIPNEILHKKLALTDDEIAMIRTHGDHSRAILKKIPDLSDTSFNVSAHQHEHVDGSGHPDGLLDHEISLEGKMCAIVDIYDAIITDRIHSKSIPSSIALTKLLELSGTQLNEQLVRRFIQTMGIYPAGTLVKLNSNRLAVVLEPSGESEILPLVKVFYHTAHKQFLPTEILDLGQPNVHDFIVKTACPEDWNIRLVDILS